jgi:tRNA pseudouridine55 synthase
LGLSSAQAVARVKRLTGVARAGHAGTLDPLATGLLLVALGEATKLAGYVSRSSKVYRFEVRWGEGRASDDAEGEVTGTSPVRPTGAEIRAKLGAFTGDILQVPPVFSAVHVKGKRAYALARKGETVVLAPRPATVARFELLRCIDPDRAEFEVEVSTGTYVRALARDLAIALGTLGHVTVLRRIRLGTVDEASAISLANLEALRHSPALAAAVLPLTTVLDDIPVLAVGNVGAERLRHGQPISAAELAPDTAPSEGGMALLLEAGRPVALVERAGEVLRPVRGFNL